MNSFRKIGALILFICFALLYCGNPQQTNPPSNVGGFSGIAGESGEGGSDEVDSGAGIAGFNLNLGGNFNFDGGNEIAGSGGYVLPSDFTPGLFGGFKLGKEINSNTPSGNGGNSGAICGTQILGVVRDFKGSNETNGHSDFEHFSGGDISEGIVNLILGTDQKPVYSSTGSFIDPNYGQQTTTKTNFDQWYRNSEINKSYVIYLYFEPNQGILTFHSNLFFPLDNFGFGNGPNSHNFGFTTEIHTRFDYNGGEEFNFVGDDDVWVFINNILAIDLGGVHQPVSKSVSLDDEADKLNIQIGKNYSLDLFHAERHTVESNFRVDTNLSFTNCGTIIDIPR